MGEYFSYFIFFGSNTVHFLSRIVPDQMVLQQFSFQTVIDGAYPKLAKNKRKGWPRFPLSLDCLVIQNSTHATMLGKEITIMKLGEASKRMHDPKAFLVSLFAQEKAKFNYTHEYFPNDSMYMGFVDFRQTLHKITDPEVKSHVFKYQKEIKETTLYK